MQNYYENMMLEVNGRVKEKLNGLRTFMESRPGGFVIRRL